MIFSFGLWTFPNIYLFSDIQAKRLTLLDLFHLSHLVFFVHEIKIKVNWSKLNRDICVLIIHFLIFNYFLISPGVADGVGGWTRYGIDAGEFSSFLMRTCERLVQNSNFNPQQPVHLLANSYHELLDHKKPILGKFIIFNFVITIIRLLKTSIALIIL